MKKNNSDMFFYHGSPCEISEFSFKFMGHGNDQLGSGFYFTSVRKDAVGYTEPNEVSSKHLDAEHSPTVHKVKLTFANPLDSKHVQSLTKSQVRAIIERAPNLMETLTNFDDVQTYGYEKVIRPVIDIFAGNNETPLLQTLNLISNDFFRESIKEFNEAVRDILGYDSVIERQGKSYCAVAWFPEQVEIISRTKHVKLEADTSPSP